MNLMKNTLLVGITLLFAIPTFSLHSDSAVFYFKKGMDEKTGGRYQVAATCFDKAIELNPNYIEAYIENGRVNKEMKRTDISKAHFIKAFELDKNNEAAIIELMEVYFNYRQFQEAVDIAKKCRSCGDKDRIIAMSYYQMEDYGNAEKMLLGLVEKTPQDAEVTYTLARTYLEMGQEKKAIPYYSKAVSLNEAKSSWSNELGLIYYNNSNYKEAVKAFNKAIANGINRTNDFNENLGFAYIYSGDYENGEKLIDAIIARKPGNTELIRDAAQAFYDSKKYDKCLDYCQKLMEINMKDGQALYQAGLCFQKKGEVSRGQQMCDKAIELDPSLAGKRHKKMEMGL